MRSQLLATSIGALALAACGAMRGMDVDAGPEDLGGDAPPDTGSPPADAGCTAAGRQLLVEFAAD